MSIESTREEQRESVAVQRLVRGLVRMEVELRYDPDAMHGNCDESKAYFLDVLLGNSLMLHSNEIGEEVGSVKVTRILSSTHLPKCMICGGEEPCSHNFNHPNNKHEN